MDYRGCSLPRTCYPHLGPQQLWANERGLGIFQQAMPRKSVTYGKTAVFPAIDQLLNKALKGTYSEACRGRRTPYPQNGQQTLGATGVRSISNCGKPLEAAKYRGFTRIIEPEQRIWMFFDQTIQAQVLRGLQR